MTARADEFIAANARSPVVYGSIVSRARTSPPVAIGMVYRLEDGQRFHLTRRDLASLKGVHSPRWAHHV